MQWTMIQRTTAIDYLKTLKAVYDTDGPSGLAQAVAQPIHHPDEVREHKLMGLLFQQRTLLKLPDAKSQIDLINANLATAASHAAWLK